MIHVIAFDLDDTLWDNGPVIRNAERTLVNWLQEHVSGFSYNVDEMRKIRIELLTANPSLKSQITQMRRRIIEVSLTQFGLSGTEAVDVGTMAMQVFLNARNEVELYPGAIEVIKALHADFHLGTLSNGNSNVRALDIGQYFSFAFTAEDVNAAKPAPDLFLKALEHTGVRADEMIYVGDDPIKDVDAANNAGLHTIWVNNRNLHPAETNASQSIDNISGLVDAVRNITDN